MKKWSVAIFGPTGVDYTDSAAPVFPPKGAGLCLVISTAFVDEPIFVVVTELVSAGDRSALWMRNDGYVQIQIPADQANRIDILNVVSLKG